MRHHRRYGHDEGSLAGTLLKYLFLLVVLGGAGGATWLALTPMDAPVREVVRTIPNDRLGPA
jgi:hypothetical protein